jgi:hypothetical protein
MAGCGIGRRRGAGAFRDAEVNKHRRGERRILEHPLQAEGRRREGGGGGPGKGSVPLQAADLCVCVCVVCANRGVTSPCSAA